MSSRANSAIQRGQVQKRPRVEGDRRVYTQHGTSRSALPGHDSIQVGVAEAAGTSSEGIRFTPTPCEEGAALRHDLNQPRVRLKFASAMPYILVTG